MTPQHSLHQTRRPPTGDEFLAWVRIEILLADEFFRRAGCEPDQQRADAMRNRAEAIYRRIEAAWVAHQERTI